MDELVKHQESISALTDGELSAHEMAQTVTRMADSPEDRLAWLSYHVTRDVLRDGPSMAGYADTEFMQRLRQSLAQEPLRAVNLQAIETVAVNAGAVRAEGLNESKSDAANDAQFRWKWVAGLASVVMVSLVAWQAVGNLDSSATGTQLAQSNKVATPAAVVSALAMPASPQPPVMLRDPQLDALLAAHRQFGGASALQMPAGFLRNATFDGVDR